MGLRWRRFKQRVLSARLRTRGISQPTAAEIRDARERVAMRVAGCLDGGKVQRDHCLARGYCCRCGCRYCPWGYDAAKGGFTAPET